MLKCKQERTVQNLGRMHDHFKHYDGCHQTPVSSQSLIGSLVKGFKIIFGPFFETWDAFNGQTFWERQDEKRLY